MPMHRSLVAVLILAFVPFPGEAQTPGAAAPDQPPVRWATPQRDKDAASDTLTIPLELLANRPIVRLAINGHGPFPFLVVPDAPITGVDAELADLLKIRARAPGDGQPDPLFELAVVPPDPIAAALTPPVTFEVPVGTVNVSAYMPDFTSAAGPRGIISLATWPDRLVILDYARYRLTLEPGALPEPDGKEVFPLAASGELRLPLLFGDRTIDCRVDPLFQGGLLLPAAYTEEFLFDKAMRDLGTLTTRTGPLRVRETRLEGDVRLGPFLLRTPTVWLAATDAPIIGAQWLSQFAVTYDRANGRARVERPRPDTYR